MNPVKLAKLFNISPKLQSFPNSGHTYTNAEVANEPQ